MKPCFPEKFATWSALVWIAVWTFAMILLTPLMVDDMQFAAIYAEHGGEAGHLSLQGWMGYCREMYEYDNIRLANLLLLPAHVIPWVTVVAKLIFAILTAATAWMLTALACSTRRPGFAALLTVWTALVVLLPWRQYMFVTTYSSNYIGGAAAMLAAWWAMLRTDSDSSRKAVATALLLAALCALWQEAFSLPLMAGLLFVALLRKGKVGRWWWTSMAIILTVTVAMMSCPGMTERVARESSAPAWRAAPLRLAFSSCAAVGLVIVGLAATIFSRGRRWASGLLANPSFSFFAAASVASLAIAASVGYTTRTSFCAQLAATGAWIIVLKPLAARLSPGLRRAGVAVMALFVVAQGITAVCWAAKFDRQYHDLTQKITESPTATVFADVLVPEDTPLLALGMPVRNSWIDTYFLEVFRRYHAGLPGLAAVVPTALDRIDLDAMPVVDSSCGMSVTDGVIFCRERPASHTGYLHYPDLGNTVLCLTLADGSETEAEAFVTSFTAPDGRIYYYIKPFGMSADRVVAARICDWL